MTTIETIITDFTTNASKEGFVARFKLRVGNIVTIEHVGLMRLPEDPDYVHIIPPKSNAGKFVFHFAPWLRMQVNKQAAAMYTAATGIKVAGSTKGTEEKPKGPTAPVPAVEDDAAGLRRVIGEAMDAAGL